MKACFCIFDQLYLAQGANSMSHFWGKIVVETRRSFASLDPLIDLLAYLEPELWSKNPIFHKNKNIAGKV